MTNLQPRDLAALRCHIMRASSYVLNAARDFLVSLIAKTFRSIAKQDLLQVERGIFLMF